MSDTYTTFAKRKPGDQPRSFAKPRSRTHELSKLCANCQAIFQGHLKFSRGRKSDDGATAYSLYGEGRADGSLDCHLCFLRLRVLAETGVESLEGLTTRYRIESGKESGDFFALVFSYSFVPSSEELLDSSKDAFSDMFSLSPVFDETAAETLKSLVPPERSGFHNVTLSAKNLSFRHFPPYNIETEDKVVTFHRRQDIVDRGLWTSYRSTIQTETGNASSTFNTNSPSTWAIAKLWIKNCIDYHERCEMTRGTLTRLPTRLVYVGNDATTHPCLVDGSHLAASTPYVTLSHRWGNQRFMTLNTRTKDIFYRSVPAAALTPTFKDAIEATLRLGYHYIWIDSLCIEQDSADDWAAESQRMGEYYSNSVCNLAASKASDDGSGCFVNRNPLAAQPCLVRETWTNTSPQLTFHIHDSTYQFARTVHGCELGNRGWVIQETMLAPRTLYFGYDQVFWDCLGHRACEAYPAQWITQSSLNKIGRMPTYMYPNNSHLDNKLSDFLRWETLIEDYSACSLTFPEKDKLIALSGIAKAFGDPADYLAGLWRDNFCILLLWQPAKATTRHQNFIAPSWSWASMDGSVEFDNIWDDKMLDNEARFHRVGSRYRLALWGLRKEARDALAKKRLLHVRSITSSFVTLVSAEMQLAGDDATGRLTGGSLRVKGFLFGVEDVLACRAQKWPDWNHCYDMNLLWDDTSDAMQADVRANSSAYRMLPVRIRSINTLSGLIIQKTSNNPGEYRRVGLFNLRDILGKLPLESLAVVKKYLKHRPRPLEKSDYLEKTGRTKYGIAEYVISII
ncbi:heterokaryon incompatibility protein-domain-containing protein [Xylaria bambusicola]|uniref:heterokaryon incompatibility protein-domain-containing protein n=1 Tax=Xylaria bambusicola TaxID=326684 RepID=UPI0020084B48|nr:heterokaryon incompatibility protein-domain-containing protein [Xylaria bambusicola]KAI0522315.1 heterokaryon incompatibility protein-domain-containing protein [Xylaria bambusicola]